MFVIMAVNAEIFPVRPIKGIIQRISIFVVYRKEMPVFIIKLPSAFCTDKAVNLNRLFPVTTGRTTGFFQLSDDFIDRFITE